MRRSALSDAEILGFVQEMEAGRPPDEVCRMAGVSLRTLYRWRRRFGGLKPFAVRGLRSLEQENRRLKAKASGRPATVPAASPEARARPRSDVGASAVDGAQAPSAVVGRYAALRLR